MVLEHCKAVFLSASFLVLCGVSGLLLLYLALKKGEQVQHCWLLPLSSVLSNPTEAPTSEITGYIYIDCYTSSKSAILRCHLSAVAQKKHQ